MEKTGYCVLTEMRSQIAAFTLVVIGERVSFGGFLLSLVAGNNLKHRSIPTSEFADRTR